MAGTLPTALVIAGNDLRRRLRNRSFVIQAFIGPVVLAAVISAAFSGGFGFDVTIGVIDLDGSRLSTEIEQGLLRGEAGGVSFVTVDDVETARRLVDAGDDMSAAVVLPDGFAASLARPRTEPLGLVLDDQSPVASAVARAVASGLSARVDAGRLTTAALLASGADAPTPEELRDLDLPIALDQLGAGEELSPAATVAPGMGLLFLFFTVSALARSLLEERRLRVLDRIRAAPVPAASILIAKAIGVLIVGVVSIVTLWVATSLLLGAAWGDPAGVLAIVVAATLAVAGLAGIIAGVARTEQAADLLATMVAFTLGILGGSLIPLSELPEGLRTVSLFTPNGWAQRGFANLSAGGGDLGDVLPEVGVLLAWAAVTLVLAGILLPRRLAAR